MPWVILDYDTFHEFGATPNELDEQLIQRNPQWQSFQQTVKTNSWTAGAVFDQGSGVPGEYGVNPAVLMVTVGIELNWQIPPDGDLYTRVVETGKTLYEDYLAYRHQEDVRDAYPQIGNAATYALYRFLDEDLEKVGEWCETFYVMFGDCAQPQLTDGYIYVIEHSTYANVDAGLELGVWEAIGILQQAMDVYHPEWAQEEGLAKYIWNHSNAQMIGVNPRVLLVTAGISLDWQTPEGHDLQEDVSLVGVTLTQHYREFKFDEDLQASYPQVVNAESYALYAFFDYDLEKLETWQQEYDRMFGEIQPRIPAEDCQPIN